MQKDRIEFLDSLRGLASVTVVLSHFVLAYRLDIAFKAINYSPFHFFFDGFAAVTFFFVLSGYVLTLSLERRPKIDLGDFYLRRVFRIMPTYLVILFISLICYFSYQVIHTIPDSDPWIINFWSHPLNMSTFLPQLFFFRSAGFAELVVQNWTLLIEMKFSFMLPFLYFIYKKTNFTFFLIFNFVLAVFFNSQVFIFHFSMGMCLALNQNYILDFFKNIKARYKVGLFCLTVFLYTYRYTVPMYYYFFMRKLNFLNDDNTIWLLTGFGSFIILLYCFTNLKAQQVLNLPFFKYIGKLSYSIYLTHMMVLIFMVPLFVRQLNSFGITNKYMVWLFACVFLLSTTILISHFLTKLIETPFVKFGNNLLKKVNRKKDIKTSFINDSL